MASNSQTTLNSAATAVNAAFGRLLAAIDTAVAERASLAAAREAAEVNVSADWRARCDRLQAALTEAQAENTYLLSETVRLETELNTLQEEHRELEGTATDALARLNASVTQLDIMLEHQGA